MTHTGNATLMKPRWILISFVLLMACGGSQRTIPGTEVPASEENRQILSTIEAYRQAVEQKDAAALVMMAHPEYREDGGTTAGTDDYGYDELRQVLAGRFQKAQDIRYSLRYLKVQRQGDLAFVDALVSASYTIRDAKGELVRQDKRDQNQFVLIWDEQSEGWKFLSGM